MREELNLTKMQHLKFRTFYKHVCNYTFSGPGVLKVRILVHTEVHSHSGSQKAMLVCDLLS